MDTKSFERYNNDNSVFKFGGWHGVCFINDDNNIIICFVFLHQGFKFDSSNSEKRIIFKVIKAENYKGEKPLRTISNEALFLVNADNPDYSILFRSSIDSKNHIAKLELVEPPSLGLAILSLEEKNGISIEF